MNRLEEFIGKGNPGMVILICLMEFRFHCILEIINKFAICLEFVGLCGQKFAYDAVDAEMRRCYQPCGEISPNFVWRHLPFRPLAPMR